MLKDRYPDVQAVYLFGSLASGVPTPRSDADLLIVSSEKDLPGIEAVFLSPSIPVELFVVTPEAFERKRRRNRGIVGAAVRTGERLL